MSELAINQVPFAPPLGCYICFINKAKDAQQQRQMLPGQQQQPQLSLKEPQTGPPGILCYGCKMQRYCSVQHFVEDGEHNDICKVLTDLRQSQGISHPLLFNGPILGRSQLQLTLWQLMLAARVRLRRQLSRRECELIGYPAFCVVCHSLEALIVCEGCAGVAYCSVEHRLLDQKYHTLEACETIAKYHSPYRLLDTHLQIERFDQSCDLQRSDLPKAFANATGIQLDCQPWRSLKDYERFATCSSFSGIGTVCLALTHITFVAHPQDVLSVYVVGAKEKHRRYFQQMHLKFFFLQYNDVCQLEVNFIGHKLQPKSEEEVLTFEFNGAERKVVLRTFSMTFTRFATSHSVDPVLIIMYDPDFADGGKAIVKRRFPLDEQAAEQIDFSWQSCLLEALHTYGVPICYTSSTKMLAQSDFKCIRLLAEANDIYVNRLYSCTDNPYREILPMHNRCPNDTETVIYANNYVEVVFAWMSDSQS